MILQALYQLAQDEELMGDPDFQMKPVAWLVRVDQDGKLLGIGSTLYTPAATDEKKRPREQAKIFKIPRQAPTRTGTKPSPELLVDNALFTFGIDLAGKFNESEPRKRADRFRERVRDCFEATKDEGVGAVLRFLEDVASNRQIVELPENCASNHLFAFVYAPDRDKLVNERQKVRDYWKQLRAAPEKASSKRHRCLVSGALCSPAKQMPKLQGVPGGVGSGTKIVSFNKKAFESYGWSRNENAPISRDAAEACSTALNRLLHQAFPDMQQPGQTLPCRNIRLSADTAVCYWAAGKGQQEFVSAFSGILDANPESVQKAYHSIWRGKAQEIEDPSAFYALTLSGSQGRAIIRGWFETTVQEVADNLAAHFRDISIVRNTPKPKKGPLPPQLPFRTLLESLAPLGNSKEIPAPMAEQLLNAAMRGTVYPFSILQRAILRMRAEIGRNDWPDMARRDARAALIKAVLNRRKRFFPHCQYQEVKEEMDPTNKNPGYLLGRLMAVIERMQQVALGDVGATVVDRYFSGASATPQTVFPRLMKGYRHHAAKAKDNSSTSGTARWLEKQTDEIMVDIHAFPASLSLEDQGLFIIGYHHMRHDLWTSKKDRDEQDTNDRD